MQIKRRSRSRASPGSAGRPSALKTGLVGGRRINPETGYLMVSVILNLPNGPSDIVLACIRITYVPVAGKV